MIASPGQLVRMRMDWQGPPPAEGEYLRTARGSAYEVLEVFPVRGRGSAFRIVALKLDGLKDIPPTGICRWIQWYSRKRRI